MVFISIRIIENSQRKKVPGSQALRQASRLTEAESNNLVILQLILHIAPKQYRTKIDGYAPQRDTMHRTVNVCPIFPTSVILSQRAEDDRLHNSVEWYGMVGRSGLV